MPQASVIVYRQGTRYLLAAVYVNAFGGSQSSLQLAEQSCIAAMSYLDCVLTSLMCATGGSAAASSSCQWDINAQSAVLLGIRCSCQEA